DLFEELGVDEAVLGGIAVDQPHDALSVADQLPDPPDIEPGIGAAKAMDLDQVVAQGVGPAPIDLQKRSSLPQPDQVLEISLPLRVLHQEKRLLQLSEGEERSIPLKAADIEGADMARQPVEGGMAPDHRLSAVGHPFMAERARAHRLQNGAVRPAGDLE